MISRHSIVAVAAAAALGAAALSATAQQPSGATPQQAQPQRPYANQLMTQEERDAYRKQIQDAKTPEARTKIRDAHRAEMQKRAEAQGLTLQGRSGQPHMYGSDLMTPQERDAYIEKLRSAKTQDERLKLRDEHRTEMQKRARDTGVPLPEPRRQDAAKAPMPPGAPEPALRGRALLAGGATGVLRQDEGGANTGRAREDSGGAPGDRRRPRERERHHPHGARPGRAQGAVARRARQSRRFSATSSSRLPMVRSQLKWACPSSNVWRQLAQLVTVSSAPVASSCLILISNAL